MNDFAREVPVLTGVDPSTLAVRLPLINGAELAIPGIPHDLDQALAEQFRLLDDGLSHGSTISLEYLGSSLKTIFEQIEKATDSSLQLPDQTRAAIADRVRESVVNHLNTGLSNAYHIL